MTLGPFVWEKIVIFESFAGITPIDRRLTTLSKKILIASLLQMLLRVWWPPIFLTRPDVSKSSEPQIFGTWHDFIDFHLR